MIIAIDGPAASGKSSIAKSLADKLDFEYLSTGLMYRAVTAFILQNNLLKDFPNSVTNLINSLNIEVDIDNVNDIRINNINYSEHYFSSDVSNNVSLISSDILVRSKLVNIQQKIANSKNLVCEGRDIGTVVFPNADSKFYIDATIECRVMRRYNEFKDNKHKISKNDLKQSLMNRDSFDSSRKISPLVKADDAILIDTTNLKIEEVVNILCKHINGDIK